MKRKIIISAILIVVAATSSGTWYVLHRKTDTNKSPDGLPFTEPGAPAPDAAKSTEKPTAKGYPTDWVKMDIGSEEKKAGVVQKYYKGNHDATFVVRTITGTLDKDFDIKTLPDAVAKSLQSRFQVTAILDKSIEKLGKYNTVKIIFKHKNFSDSETHQNFMTIVPTAKKTYYITFSSSENDFESFKKDFDIVRDIYLEKI